MKIIVTIIFFMIFVSMANAEENNIPNRIIIESINLASPVTISRNIEIKPGIFQHEVHNTLPSWHDDSAKLLQGNVVINGHNFSVFKNLHLIKIGDKITINDTIFIVREKVILKEKNQPIDVRIKNAQYIMPTDDNRLTLITCYNGNNDRLIIIAFPE